MTHAAAGATAAYCRNCNLFLGEKPGNYCPHCGQETANHPPTLWEFVHEFITHYVALEGKLWRTMWMLFFRPAELTREYRAGRRTRYISPLRLYITASFLFFLVVKFAGIGNLMNTEARTEPDLQLKRGLAVTTTVPPPTVDKALEEFEVNQDKIDFDCKPGEEYCLALQSRLQKKYVGKSGKQVLDVLKAGMLANFPYALFLMLPLFAGLTKLLYLRRGMYYGEHVVYALHIHAFTFFVLLLKALLPRYVGDVVLIGAWVYYFVALQRFFGGRWWATGMRYAIIATVYPILLVLVTTTVLFYVLIA